MRVFIQSKVIKPMAVASLLALMVLIATGCSSRTNSRSLMTNLDMILETIDVVSKVGILPRSLAVPVTTDEVPIGLIASITDTGGTVSIGILLGFSGFSQQEIDQSSQTTIPLLTGLLQQSVGADVELFMPAELASIGLTDAQLVHNLVINDLLDNLDLYVRCYVSKVPGPQGTNIRSDCYGWAPGSFESGQFLFRLEVQESLFNQVFQAI